VPLATGEVLEAARGVIWALPRIGAMLLAVPIFGSQTMPTTIRSLVTLTLAVFVASFTPTTAELDPLSVVGLVTVVHEVLVGIAMGFALQLVMSAFAQAGESIALAMGLGFASMVDPQNGLRVPVISQYYVIIITLLFLTFDAHLIALEVLVDSFRTLPVGAGLAPEAAMRIAQWGSHMFLGAVIISLPIVASQLMIYLALGVITRAAPQLNIFAVGFPMLILAGFIMMWLTLPGIPGLFEGLLEDGVALMRDTVRGN